MVQEPLPRQGQRVLNILDQIPVSGDESLFAGVALRHPRWTRHIDDLVLRVDATDAQFGCAELLPDRHFDIARDGRIAGEPVHRDCPAAGTRFFHAPEIGSEELY